MESPHNVFLHWAPPAKAAIASVSNVRQDNHYNKKEIKINQSVIKSKPCWKDIQESTLEKVRLDGVAASWAPDSSQTVCWFLENSEYLWLLSEMLSNHWNSSVWILWSGVPGGNVPLRISGGFKKRGGGFNHRMHCVNFREVILLSQLYEAAGFFNCSCMLMEEGKGQGRNGIVPAPTGKLILEILQDAELGVTQRPKDWAANERGCPGRPSPLPQTRQVALHKSHPLSLLSAPHPPRQYGHSNYLMKLF